METVTASGRTSITPPDVPIRLSSVEIDALSLIWAKGVYHLFETGMRELLFESPLPCYAGQYLITLRRKMPLYVEVMGETFYCDLRVIASDWYEAFIERVGDGPRWSVGIRYAYQKFDRENERHPVQAFRGNRAALDTDLVMVRIALANPPG